MKTYEIAITITDTTSVNASTEDEAYELARTVFAESGYYQMDSNAELDIIGIGKDDSGVTE